MIMLDKRILIAFLVSFIILNCYQLNSAYKQYSRLSEMTQRFLNNWGDSLNREGDLADELIAADQLEITDILSRVSAFEDKVVFLGDGATLHSELIRETLGGNAVIAPKHLLISSASSLCEIAMRKYSDTGVSYDDVHANYLRKSQAEREYDERQVKK